MRRLSERYIEDLRMGRINVGEAVARATDSYWRMVSFDAHRFFEEVDSYAAGSPCVRIVNPEASHTITFYKDEGGAFVGWGESAAGLTRYGASSHLEDLVSFINKKLPTSLPSIDVKICL